MNADQLNHDAARRQMEGTMSDEAIWRRKAERERDSAREQLAAAKAENERLSVTALAAIERVKDWNARHEMVADALRERDAAVQAKGLEIKAAHDELRRLELRIADLVQARDIAAETAALAAQRAEVERNAKLAAWVELDELRAGSDALRQKAVVAEHTKAAALAEVARLKLIAEGAEKNNALLMAGMESSELSRQELKQSERSALRERDAANARADQAEADARYWHHMGEKIEDELRDAKDELMRREANGNLIEQRDAAVQAKERAEADAAVLREASEKLRHATYCLRWEDRKRETEAALDGMKAALATNAGAPLLEERDRLREVEAAAVALLKDLDESGDESCWCLVPSPDQQFVGVCEACRLRAALAQQPDQRKDG